MKFRDSWRKYKDWIYVLIVIAIITLYAFWYLSLNPQYITSFLVAPIIAMVVVILLMLMPEKRRQLAKAIIAYNARQKALGGWLYRYRRNALVLFLILILTFPLLSQYQLIPPQLMPWAVLTFLIVIIFLVAIQIAGLIKALGLWGLLLIAIITAIAVLRFLIGRWLR